MYIVIVEEYAARARGKKRRLPSHIVGIDGLQRHKYQMLCKVTVGLTESGKTFCRLMSRVSCLRVVKICKVEHSFANQLWLLPPLDSPDVSAFKHDQLFYLHSYAKLGTITPPHLP